MTTKEFNEKVEKAISESTQQFRVTKWLDQRNIIYFAVPNGYKKSIYQQSQAKREGLKSGVPDIIILTKAKNGKSTVLEMKRYKKHRGLCNCIKDDQKMWQEIFISHEWNYVLGHGCDEAINDLLALGY